MSLIQVIVYAAILFFVGAVAVKAYKYGTTPVHLRWELYPVAHEKGRASYGGSIFEEFEWWTKPRELDKVNELKEMFEEIVLLKGVFLNNRGLWFSSFPFHFGLYMAITMIGLMVVFGVLSLVGLPAANVLMKLVLTLSSLTGLIGFFLIIIGAFGLLYRRANNPEMSRFNTPIEYLNLVVIIIVSAVVLMVQGLTDPGFTKLGGFFTDMIGFRAVSEIGFGLGLEVLLAAMLIAYMPLTRMSHFVAKYFLYHQVRWSDEPNVRGSKIEKEVIDALNFGVSWEAPHIQTGKSWGEVLTEDKK